MTEWTSFGVILVAVTKSLRKILFSIKIQRNLINTPRWINYSLVLPLLGYITCCIFKFLSVYVLDLPVTSPLSNAVLKTLENWEQLLVERMNKFDGPPPNYINTYPTDLSAGGGPAILRHKAMLEPDNMPFKWVYCITKEHATGERTLSD